MVGLPEVPSSFAWVQEPWGVALVCEPLRELARHVFTTRQLTLSSMEGCAALAASLGVTQGRVHRLTQVHGAGVVVKAAHDRFPSWEVPEGDALVSDDQSVGLAVRAADCAPILMADRRTGAAGAVHAGWRGTAARVVTAAVDAMATAFDSRPADLVVAVGPSIGVCCYEVGTELVDAFAAEGHERYLIDRWFHAPPARKGESGRPRLRLDVAGANRDQLVLAGVPEDQIHLANLCTAEHLELLTSFRAEREQAGRMAGAIRPGAPLSP